MQKTEKNREGQKFVNMKRIDKKKKILKSYCYSSFQHFNL